MELILLTIHLIIVALLIVVVLFQQADSSGLLSSNMTGGLMSSRGSTNFLIKLTRVLAAIFFCTSISLALLGKHSQKTDAKILEEITDSKDLLPSLDLSKPIEQQDLLGAIGGDRPVTTKDDKDENQEQNTQQNQQSGDSTESSGKSGDSTESSGKSGDSTESSGKSENNK